MKRYVLCIKIGSGQLAQEVEDFRGRVEDKFPELTSEKYPVDLYHVNMLTFVLPGSVALDILIDRIQDRIDEMEEALVPIHIIRVAHHECSHSIKAHMDISPIITNIRKLFIREVSKMGGAAWCSEDWLGWNKYLTIYQSFPGSQKTAIFQDASRMFKPRYEVDYISDLHICDITTSDPLLDTVDRTVDSWSSCVKTLILDYDACPEVVNK